MRATEFGNLDSRLMTSHNKVRPHVAGLFRFRSQCLYYGDVRSGLSVRLVFLPPVGIVRTSPVLAGREAQRFRPSWPRLSISGTEWPRSPLSAR